MLFRLTTLSGGEAQRVKLSRELSKRDTGSTLYILDEPTTGLHFEDIRQLLEVLHRLRDGGNNATTVVHFSRSGRPKCGAFGDFRRIRDDSTSLFALTAALAIACGVMITNHAVEKLSIESVEQSIEATP